MRHYGRVGIMLIVIVGLMGGVARVTAHKDPCHQRHACPSDTGSYVCGDKGHCDQCADNHFCLAGKPRQVISPSPAAALPISTPSQPPVSAEVSVCFTPGQNCTDLVVQALAKAQKRVLVQAYGFTSAPIAQALREVHKRGVRVETILDSSNRTDKYSAADFLANQGVPTRIDAMHAIAHNKIIIDDEIVITGSFNFTKAAQARNAENLLLIHGQAIAAQYTENWQAHAEHSQPYVGRGVRQ